MNPITFWLSLLHAQRVAMYTPYVDRNSFLQWREHGIAGVPNISGV
jgi:hypothetical protein